MRKIKQQVECALIKKLTYRPINWSIYQESYYCGNCKKQIEFGKEDKYCRFCGSKFIDKKIEYDITPKELCKKILISKVGKEKAEIMLNNLSKASEKIKICGISKIEKGDTVKCIDCGKPITLDDNTFIFDCEAEYIYCPHCKSKKDIQIYHLKGEKL